VGAGDDESFGNRFAPYLFFRSFSQFSENSSGTIQPRIYADRHGYFFFYYHIQIF